MAFKLNPPYQFDNTPVYELDMSDEGNLLGRADKNGSVLINKEMRNPKQRDSVIEHEKVHLDQMERGDLDYDDGYVYWRGKKYARSTMNEGAKNLPWEKEAYSKVKEV